MSSHICFNCIHKYNPKECEDCINNPKYWNKYEPITFENYKMVKNGN
ncbi:MAG: hypothetical protein ACTSR3_01030 [Candidatus Helarchaeota archaeon]